MTENAAHRGCITLDDSRGEHHPKLLSWERLRVDHAGAGTGGTPSGRTSTCQQRDNCPTLTDLNMSPHRLWTTNVDNFLLKSHTSAYTGKCLMAPPVPAAESARTCWTLLPERCDFLGVTVFHSKCLMHMLVKDSPRKGIAVDYCDYG